MKRLALAAALLVSSVASADDGVVRLGLFVGDNLGAADDEPLRYAESDARRMRDLLVEVSDLSVDSIVVTGTSPERVLAATEQLSARARAVQAEGRRPQIFFYYSGHGDDAALHLRGGRLPLDVLRAALALVPGELHLALVDACRGVGRTKGVTRGPAFSAAIPVDHPTGRVELRASSEGESAQESDELGGSVFSHFVSSGLRGAADADGDGRVTLAELYAYVYDRTLLRTGTTGALQHPTLAVDLAGAGEVVLARTVKSAGTLEVPPDGERYLVFQLPRGVPLGELSGEPGRRLALPAGRFLVVRRARSSISVAEVDLSWGGHRVLSPLELRPMSREELVARGGRVELHPFRLEPRIGVEVALGSIERPATQASVALAWAHGVFEAEGALGVVGGEARSATLRGHEEAVLARFAVGLRLVKGRLGFNPSIGLAARYTFQQLAYVDAQRRDAAGLPTRQDGRGLALGPEVALRVGLALSHRIVLSPVVGVSLLFRRESSAALGDSATFHPVLSIGIGLGYTL